MKVFNRLFHRDTIRKQLQTLVVIFTIIISFLILIPTFYLEYKETTKLQYEEMNYFLEGQSYFFESWLNERANNIQTISNLEFVKEYDYVKSKEFFYKFKEETDFADIVFVSKEGIVQFDTVKRDSDDIVGIDVTDREYFKVAKQGKAEHITDVLTSLVTEIPIVIIASTILDENQQFNGVVFGTVNLETIDQLLYESRVGFLGHAYVVNQDGILLTEMNSDGHTIGNTENLSKNYVIDDHILEVAKVESGLSLYKNAKDEWVLGASKTINDGKWYIMSEVRIVEAYMPLIKKLALLSLCILIGAFTTIRLMLYIARKIEKPVEHLIEGVRYIERGNYDYQINDNKIYPSTKEFSELCSAFNRMSAKVKQHIILLEDLTITCQLTNIYNRRYLMDKGEGIFSNCVESKNHCSCLVIDIDYFKNVNDSYGHAIGDDVLIHVSKLISVSTRETDVVTRYGGEEFIVISPYSSMENSIKVAERIREKVESTPFKIGQSKIDITVSIGVAEYYSMGDITTFSELIDRADKALYQAKESGRNQIGLYKNKYGYSSPVMSEL